MQGNELRIRKDDGTVTAGLSGSQSGEKIRIWVRSSLLNDMYRTHDVRVHRLGVYQIHFGGTGHVVQQSRGVPPEATP